MSTNWRIRKSSVGSWTNLRTLSFDWADRIQTESFPIHGRNYTGVSAGLASGLRGTVKVLVRDAATDTALMGILKSREMLVMENSLGHSWDVRAIGDIDRKQNLTTAESGIYAVKHEFFVTFKVVQVTSRVDEVDTSPSTFDSSVFGEGVFI